MTVYQKSRETFVTCVRRNFQWNIRHLMINEVDEVNKITLVCSRIRKYVSAVGHRLGLRCQRYSRLTNVAERDVPTGL